MPVRMKEIRAALEPEEPDYDEAAKMGAEALPHLQTLVKEDDPEMASKAASLAGMISDERSVAVLKIAASSHDPVIRVAAAGAARGLSDSDASQVLELLVADVDVGVQKTALKSIPANPSLGLRSRLADVSSRGDLPPSVVESIRGIVEKLESSERPQETTKASEMPDTDGEMPGLDAATSVDEISSGSSEEEREMPGFDGPINFTASDLEEMPESDQAADEEFSEEREMPGFDESKSSVSGSNMFEPEILDEMPS